MALKTLRGSGISGTPASPSVSNQGALQARTQRGQESSPPHQVSHVHLVSLPIRVRITPRYPVLLHITCLLHLCTGKRVGENVCVSKGWQSMGRAKERWSVHASGAALQNYMVAGKARLLIADAWFRTRSRTTEVSEDMWCHQLAAAPSSSTRGTA